jgi:hypothetical protein
LNDLLRSKINKMKDYPFIPYIKSDSFYIKHYSNEIYDVFYFLNIKNNLAITNAFKQTLRRDEKLKKFMII